MILKIENLSFSYDNKKDIFKNINTIVNTGDFIGIFGENGAGKTTLVNIILGILKPKSGNIKWYIDGKNEVSKNNLNIEYISQKSQSLDSIIPITVGEVVKLGNKNKKRGIISHFSSNCSYENILKALEHTNMLEFINTPFKNLSGGQKQRVLIAKALISNPDIIIMDEPTSGVDLVAQKHFYDLLSHLNEVHKITIILISHDTKFIQEKIKRLWYIGNSNCDECGNEKLHLLNIKMIFKNQKVEFLN